MYSRESGCISGVDKDDIAPRPRMMQRGLGLGCREKIDPLLCTIHARAPVCGSVAPAWSCMRIRVHPSRRVPRGASGGAGGCGAGGRAAGHHACDTTVHRPACWGLARERFARFVQRTRASLDAKPTARGGRPLPPLPRRFQKRFSEELKRDNGCVLFIF